MAIDHTLHSKMTVSPVDGNDPAPNLDRHSESLFLTIPGELTERRRDKILSITDFHALTPSIRSTRYGGFCACSQNATVLGE